jgi:serine/threonine protein kinase
VKTLSAQSNQGVQEFLNEIKTISKVKHPNLVELIGCCAQGTNRILVYEYVENNSLDRALLGNLNRNFIVKAELWLFPIMARQKCTIMCYPFQVQGVQILN